MLRIFYGCGQTFLDVTARAFERCYDGTRIYIPSGDTADLFFPDPSVGNVKSIVVFRNEGAETSCQQFHPGQEIRIHPTDDEKRDAGVDRLAERRMVSPPDELSTAERINFYHEQLICSGGYITHEWCEQSMVVDFMDADAKVLELGSNVGRNTLMISCVLNDERNLVTLECNPFFVELLRNNRFANDFHFHIEPSALSYRRLIQSKRHHQYGNAGEAWEAIPSETLEEGYEWVSTITFEQLKDKYRLDFDTLVADCEGALFYILQDNPGMLKNMKTIILESDYRQAGQKPAVERVFTDFGFEKVYSLPLDTDVSELPQECVDSFWEVWKRGR